MTEQLDMSAVMIKVVLFLNIALVAYLEYYMIHINNVRPKGREDGAIVAGYSKLYVVGSLGGFMGTDGIDPIEFLILVDNADRQWLEPHYFDRSIMPIGRLRAIMPLGPNHPDSLLDACIAFCPRRFKSCPSLVEVEPALGETDRLDFDASPQKIPGAWVRLREEARPLFAAMNIWRADLVPMERT